MYQPIDVVLCDYLDTFRVTLSLPDLHYRVDTIAEYLTPDDFHRLCNTIECARKQAAALVSLSEKFGENVE